MRPSRTFLVSIGLVAALAVAGTAFEMGRLFEGSERHKAPADGSRARRADGPVSRTVGPAALTASIAWNRPPATTGTVARTPGAVHVVSRTTIPGESDDPLRARFLKSAEEHESRVTGRLTSISGEEAIGRDRKGRLVKDWESAMHRELATKCRRAAETGAPQVEPDPDPEQFHRAFRQAVWDRRTEALRKRDEWLRKLSADEEPDVLAPEVGP